MTEISDALKRLEELTHELPTLDSMVKKESPNKTVINAIDGDITMIANYKSDSVADSRVVVQAGTKMKCHNHGEIEIFVVYKGSMQVFVDHSAPVILKKGDVFRVPPNVPHSAVWNEDCEMIAITIPAADAFPDREDQ